MAEKSEKKPDAAAGGAAGAGKDHGKEKEAPAAAHGAGGGGLFTKLPVLLGGVMIIEAVVLFAGFKFLGGGGPHTAAAAELATQTTGEGKSDGKDGAKSTDDKSTVEIQVVDFRAPNKLSGRTFLYDVSIFLVTKAEYQDKIKE